MTNTTTIKFRFKIGLYSNTSMGLKVRVNNKTILDVDQFLQDWHELEFSAMLPLIVEFETIGKMLSDTLIDSNGDILEDKFISIEQMSVDGIWIKQWILESRLFENATSNIKTNYFGQNGIARFQIPYSDIMQFWLDTVTVDD